MKKNLDVRRVISIGILIAFLANTFGPMPQALAGPASPAGGEFQLPAPGTMVHVSPEFNPPLLKGIKVHPDNPLRFEFILDRGDVKTPLMASLRGESTKLIKYFLASLTIPEKDLWVNLSPYEKDRIVPQSFGQTEMGRDLLAEDYMLKQITASLIYPEDETGRKFWKRVYEEAYKKFGTTNIPVNTFNKVWILPDKAVVYENVQAGTAYVVESKLKVMLEEDYLSLTKHQPTNVNPGTWLQPCPQSGCQPNQALHTKAPQGNPGIATPLNTLGSQIIREIVIPELTKEVNEGKNFAQLRQVYNSLILATWYKKKIKDSILAQVYEGKKKVAGVGYKNSSIEVIYQRYLQAFKKGVYNYIKEEQDPLTRQVVPRKYFSGGLTMDGPAMDAAMSITHHLDATPNKAIRVSVNIQPLNFGPADKAMIGKKQALLSAMHDALYEYGNQLRHLKVGISMWDAVAALTYLHLFKASHALLEELNGGEVDYIYPFAGPDLIPNIFGRTFRVNNDVEDFWRGKLKIEEELGEDFPEVRSAIEKNNTTNESKNAYSISDYESALQGSRPGKRVLILKGFDWERKPNGRYVLKSLLGRLSKGDKILVLSSVQSLSVPLVEILEDIRFEPIEEFKEIQGWPKATPFIKCSYNGKSSILLLPDTYLLLEKKGVRGNVVPIRSEEDRAMRAQQNKEELDGIIGFLKENDFGAAAYAIAGYLDQFQTYENEGPGADHLDLLDLFKSLIHYVESGQASLKQLEFIENYFENLGGLRQHLRIKAPSEILLAIVRSHQSPQIHIVSNGYGKLIDIILSRPQEGKDLAMSRAVSSPADFDHAQTIPRAKIVRHLLNGWVITDKAGIKYKIMTSGIIKVVDINLKRIKDGMVFGSRELMSFDVEDDGSIFGLAINFYNDNELLDKGIAKELYKALGSILPEGTKIEGRLQNRQSRQMLAEQCTVDSKGDVFFKPDKNKPDLLRVVQDAPAGPGEITLNDVLSQTMIGKLHQQAFMGSLNITYERILGKPPVYSGVRALAKLWKARAKRGNLWFVPSFNLFAVKSPVINEKSDRAMFTNLKKRFVSAISKMKLNLSKFKIEKSFDMNTILLNRDASPREIVQAEQLSAAHRVIIDDPTPAQVESLSKEGYFYMPNGINYRIDLPQGKNVNDAMEEYYARFKSKNRKHLKSDVSKIDEAIARGDLSLVDSNDDPKDIEDFLRLYQDVIGSKERGSLPLMELIKRSGLSAAVFIKRQYLGLYLRNKEGHVIGGLIVQKNSYGYSISFSATEYKAGFNNIKFYLTQVMMRKSIAKGFREMGRGSDPNFYGHDLSVGLLQSKINFGFMPYAAGGKALMKITNYEIFKMPVFFYSYGPKGELESNLIITEAGLSRINEFKGASPKLNVYILKNGQLQLMETGDNAQSSGTDRAMTAELRQIMSEIPAAQKYPGAEEWFLPYVQAGLNEGELRGLVQKAFRKHASPWITSFNFNEVQKETVDHGIDQVINSHQNNLIITGFGSGDEYAEPLLLVNLALRRLHNRTHGIDSITLRNYENDIPVLWEMARSLPSQLESMISKDFQEWKGRVKVEMFYGNIIDMSNPGDLSLGVLKPSNITILRNTWVLTDGLNYENFMSFLDVLRKHISAGALIVQERHSPLPAVEINEVVRSDSAMINRKGGIDLTAANMDLQTQMPANPSDWRGLASFAGGDSRFRLPPGSSGGGNDGGINGGIKFHLDPAMLERLRDSSGFVPVIISVQPLPAGQAGIMDLRRFLMNP